MSRYDGKTNTVFTSTLCIASAASIASANRPFRFNRGRWYINCPAHGGDGQNLAVWDGEDGIGAKCHSVGCTYAEIMRALDVPWTYRHRRERKYEARRMATYQHLDGTLRESWRADYPEDFLAGPCTYGATTTRPCKKGTKPHKHLFTKPSGRPRAGVLPLLWTPDQPSNLLVVTEGEPAASQLAQFAISGITPVSYFGGGGAARETSWGETLTGRRVVIWPDPDAAGEKAKSDLLAIAHETGAVQVLVVQVDDLAGGENGKSKDAADLGPEECESRILRATARPPGSYNSSASNLVEAPPEPLSQRRLAQSFASEWAEKYSYDEAANVWRLWNGVAWQEAGLEITRDIGEHIENVMKREGNLSSHFLSFTALNGVKKLAEAFLAETFDADPDLLALSNGEVLNVQTGQHDELKRGHRITRFLPEGIRHLQRPPRDGQPAEWENFVWKSLEHYDPANRVKVASFLQEWSGSALSGDCRDEVMAFLWGRSGTGKSTFTETLLEMFGSYGKIVSGKRVAGREEGHLQWLANLAGIRLVVFDEMPEKGRWRTDLLNPLISGQMIEANRMRENSITFKSQAHVIATGNHRPGARASSGLWRRMVIVEFQHKPAREDVHLKKRMATNLGDVYRWAVEGLRGWIRNGRHLNIPDVLLAGTRDYRAAADPVAQFVEDCLETKPGEYVTVTTLYSVFTDWWKQNVGDIVPAAQMLSTALNDLGHERTAKRRVAGKVKRVRNGLKLRNEGVTG